MGVKDYILDHPEKFKSISKVYNNTIGFNQIRINGNNKLDVKTIQLKNTKINVHGKSNIIKIGNLSRLINCTINISGNNNVIEISDKVSLNNTELHIEDNNNLISIGKHTSIHGKTHLAAIESTKIIIGEDCMFSSDIHFRTGDSHSITNLEGERLNKSEDINIGNHVWVGTKVICLKGARILDNCIVGAGTLVNKKFNESNCIIAGNPSKIISRNKNWKRERV